MKRKRVDIYHHSSKGSKEGKDKPCAWCSSTGTLSEIITGTKKTCNVCNGTGRNVFYGTVRPCPRCKGTGSKGKMLMGARIKCDVCMGRGYNQIG